MPSERMATTRWRQVHPTIADVGYRATFAVCGGVTDPGLGPAPVRCVRNDYVPCRIRFFEAKQLEGGATDRSH
jgi:hypothetical protein